MIGTYEKRDACILDFPALDHDHFDGARNVHGALCGVEVEKSDTGRACLGRMSIAGGCVIC